LAFFLHPALNLVIVNKSASQTTPARNIRMSAVATGPMIGARKLVKVKELPHIAERAKRSRISMIAMERD
jgi:hypothetical protein